MSKKEETLELMLDFGEDGRTLIPVVTQDIVSKDVLILAYVNKEAFDKTLEIGYATYWSRSRDKLWTKGEESGNRLIIKQISVNCEQNSLLYLVDLEKNGACHVKKPDGSPYKSCFYRKYNQGRLELV